MARYEPIKVRKGDIAHVLRASFPDYTGRKFRVDPNGECAFHDLHWGDGTRNEYRAVRLFDCAGRPVPVASAPWGEPLEGATVPIPPGFVVVEHSTWCGQDIGITVYCNPANLPRLLPGRDPYDTCARRMDGSEPFPAPMATVAAEGTAHDDGGTVRLTWLER